MVRRTADDYWRYAAMAAIALAALIKLLMAAHVAFIWEEASYRIAGSHPAWGFADTPAGAPLLNWLSAAMFGETRLGARLIFWLAGALIPLAVWRLADDVAGPRAAALAGLMAAVIPPVFVAGAHAYPEPILQLLFVTLLIALSGGLRSSDRRWWIAAGVICALGLAYHYRFWFVPAGLGLFAVATPQGRNLLKTRDPWIAGAIAAIGLAPGLIHNIQTGFASFTFQAAGRQEWSFWPPGLLYPLEQAAILTPVIAAFAALGALQLWRAVRRGEAFAGLVLFPAALIWLLFALLAPLNKDYLLHWPFMAYAPLLPFAAIEAERWMHGARWRAWVTAGGVALAAVASLGWAVNLMAWQSAGETRLYGGDLEDWSDLHRPLDTALLRLPGDAPAIVVASDHVTASQIAVAADPGAPVYALDHPTDAAQGFQFYWDNWGRGEADLPDAAEAVIALREPDYLYRSAERTAFRARLCGKFGDIEKLATVPLAPGVVRVSIYTARTGGETPPAACPLLPKAMIEQPQAAERMARNARPVYGVAAHPDGVRRIDVLLDGRVIAGTDQRHDLPGYRFPEVLDFDPAYPAVYWDLRVDFAPYEPGKHALGVRVTTGTGETVESDHRIIYLK